MQNTRINYMYRDACNYKTWGEIVVAGRMTIGEIVEIIGCLDGGRYFIPEQVYFPHLRPEELTEDDHCWHELTADDFVTTDEEAEYTKEEVILAFREAKGEWKDAEFEVPA